MNIKDIISEEISDYYKSRRKFVYSAPFIGNFFNSNNINILKEFLYSFAEYQSNHYGRFSDSELKNKYNTLPDGFKKAIYPFKSELINASRGTEDIESDPDEVISFGSSGNVASMFGHYIIPFSDLKSYSSLISAEKLVGLFNRKTNINYIKQIDPEFAHDIYYYDFPVGDDEGEILVIDPVFIDSYKGNNEKYYKNY